MNEKQTKAYIQSLLAEREGYEQRGLTERIEAVDEELARVARRGQKPSARAEKRPAARAEER